ncbi:hypothetical protein BGZ94_005057 [Podila epigama]|nr:hypothetical protein BGZ94_005057 [Podila epigama]
MKIHTISAVLCLAAATAFSLPVENNNERSLERRAEYPNGVQRHEHGHKEHGLEAHKDGGKKKHDDDDDDDDDNNDSKSDKGKDKSSGDDDDDADGENGGKKKKDGDKKDDDKKKKDGDKKDGDKKEGDKKEGDKRASDKKAGEEKKGAEGKKQPNGADGKKGEAGDKKAADGNGKAPAAGGAPGKAPAPAAGAAPAGDKKGVVANPATDPKIPRDYASPLWLVQPFGASVWEQGRAYVISWGPNPDPIYAKNLAAKSPVDIRLMQGPPDQLKEVAVLKKAVDSSAHAFQWTVPTTLAPGKDYSIRLTHEGQLDTYSHYFEVVKAGDPRSSKSNVGEPLLMPKKGDVPQPLDKGPVIKPAAPPNPFPADKPAAPAAAKPGAAKPANHASGAATTATVNILAVAMTLFGAVYLV